MQKLFFWPDLHQSGLTGPLERQLYGQVGWMPRGGESQPCNHIEGVKKLVSIVLGPFRMALSPELWNAGRHRLDYLSWE